MERWSSLPGYVGIYEVCTDGRVRSLPRRTGHGRPVPERILAVRKRPSGHYEVKLSRDGRSKHVGLHRVVLIAFAGPPPPGHEALHRDGNPANNSLANLHWGTRSENLRDRVRHGTHHHAIKTHCPQDHPYSEANTYVTSDGRRMCRTCLLERCRQYRAQMTPAERAAKNALRREARAQAKKEAA